MNETGHPNEIAICFAEKEITELFAALIEARGGRASIVGGVKEASRYTKIITEPKYLPEIPVSLHSACLIVGNPEAIGDSKAITLSRPLTELKVERAIARLFAVEATNN